MTDEAYEAYHWNGVHIDQMDTSHLENCLKHIKKKDFEHVWFDGDWDETTDLRPIYENMKIELRLRKLESK